VCFRFLLAGGGKTQSVGPAEFDESIQEAAEGPAALLSASSNWLRRPLDEVRTFGPCGRPRISSFVQGRCSTIGSFRACGRRALAGEHGVCPLDRADAGLERRDAAPGTLLHRALFFRRRFRRQTLSRVERLLSVRTVQTIHGRRAAELRVWHAECQPEHEARRFQAALATAPYPFHARASYPERRSLAPGIAADRQA